MHVRVRCPLVPVLTLLSAAPALAQGSDSCATAQPIAGTGTFAFDNSAATTGAEGQSESACLYFGTTGLTNDVWFAWTAPASGTAQVQTCSLATIDSKIAVYAGAGCPASAALACVDDACGLQTSVMFPCTAGATYAIQLGNYPGATGGTGSLQLDVLPPPGVIFTLVNPANGHTYHLLSPGSWTECEAVAVGLGGHLATIDDQAEQDWVVANFHDYQGVARDLWTGFNDASVEGQFAWVDGSPVGYTDWDSGEPNNANGVEDYAAIRKNNPLGFWNDLADLPTGFHANVNGLVEVGDSPIVAFCPGDGSAGACPCANNGTAGNGCDNSAATGGALLDATGTTSPDTVVLTSSGELSTVLSIFLQGNAEIAGVPFGDGLRCVGGNLKRLYVKNASGGTVSAPAAGDPSITAQSAALGDPIPGGAMRYYQTYYRDPSLAFCPSPPGNSWNVSSGLRITW